ncbi:MAG: hypothetical protein ACRC2T_10235 [Thermoguttaceae bacterium]
MAANLEDFVSRLVRGNKKITFIFTEDFFNIMGKNGVNVERYKDLRNALGHVGHRKGERAAERAGGDDALFDVDIYIIKSNFMCFRTTFRELSEGPLGMEAVILGYGTDMIDPQKAKFLMDSFFSLKEEEGMLTVSKMIAQNRKRKIVLVAESPADLKRPSLEGIIALRSLKQTIMVNTTKGPIVDCQVMKLSDSENTSSLSTLMSMFSVKY